MSPEDLERRRPVWDAMSDLFLDTETRSKVPFVARICADSDYDDATLEQIFWIEVFPEALPNLHSLYGEWLGVVLNEAALIGRAKTGRMPWVRRRLWGWMVESTWRSALEVTQWLRPLDGARRMQFAYALWLCGHRYFEIPDKPLSLFVVSQEQVDTVHEILAEAWQRYEPVCRSMLLKNEASEYSHDVRAAAVQELFVNHPRSSDV